MSAGTEADMARNEVTTIARPVQESVGFHLARMVPILAPDSSAAEVRGARRPQFVCVDLILVAGEKGRLLGVLPIAQLLALAPEVRIDEAMVREFLCVDRDTDQERIASLALHHGLTAIPVTDGPVARPASCRLKCCSPSYA
jgi:magnesium transporter